MIRTQTHPKHETKNADGTPNGFLVPIYNVNDGFFEPGREPQQAYITSIIPGHIKGPHLHFIRTGYFTCIKGNVRIVIKTIEGQFEEFYSGEDYQYLSVEVPVGYAAAIQCLGETEAIILNMPSPAWTPTMNDEHTADFGSFDFTSHRA